MQLRLIEKDAESLPANIAVVEGKTATEGMANIFSALARPEINLAVWPGAAELIAEEHRRSITAFLRAAPQREESEKLGSGKALRQGLKRAFRNAFPEAKAKTAPRRALDAWMKATGDMLRALDKSHGCENMLYVLSAETLHEEPFFHVDVPGTNSVFLLRTVFGAATLFAGDRDVETITGPGARATLRPETSTLWTPPPFAVAALSAPSAEASCVHTAPCAPLSGPAGERRLIELMDVVKTRKPLVPGP